MKRTLMILLLFAQGGISSAQEYTQFLAPISGLIHGAYGTAWLADLKFVNHSSESVFISPLADPKNPPCRTMCPSRTVPPYSAGSRYGVIEAAFPGGGGLFYVDRSKEAFVSFGSYLTELRVGMEEHEVMIPVIRTEDLSPGMQTLVHVPMREHTREHLRLYGIGAESDAVIVRVRDFTSSGTNLPVIYEATHELLLTPPGRGTEGFLSKDFPKYPMYAFLDLDALLPSFEGPTIIEIEPVDPAQKVWAMASVTTNVEQHVQIIVPQP